MRVIFLNRFYWPDEPATAQLLTDLAEQLVARGHRVSIIASHPGRDEVPRFECHHAVAIHRIRGTRWSRAGLAGKAADYATFFLGALWCLARMVRRGDIVVALTDPPLIGIGAWLVAAGRGARLFHWVQDIYPELAITLAGHRWLGITVALRNHAWRRARRCVTLGADMGAVLSHAGVPGEQISLVPNWAPAGLAPPAGSIAGKLRDEWGLQGKFIVEYSGNLGRVHDLEPVLAAAEALRDATGTVFLFVGAGPQRAALEAAVGHRGLRNVLFKPPQPRAHLGEVLALGDVHLVTLRPGCEALVFPSKLYGAAAVGRPVIFLGPRDCELARLVIDRQFGLVFERTEDAAFAAAVRDLSHDAAQRDQLGAAALVFAAEHAGPADAAAQWDAWFRELQAC